MAQLARQHITVPGLTVGRGRFADTLWSPDSTPGSYDAVNDIWTPGRGSDGRVTAASWALVPLNRWVRVASTRLDALDSVVKAALPNWSDRGNGNNGSTWRVVLSAWGGMAIDPDAPRAFFFGGGHQDSSNNGVYRFDFDKMSWAVQKLPTDLTGCDSRYTVVGTTTFTNYPPAADYESANPGGDVYRDEFHGFAAQRTPTSRHTYKGLACGDGKLWSCFGRPWELDLASGDWTPRMPFNTPVGSYASSTGYMGNGVIAWYDEVRNSLCAGGAETYKTWEYTRGTGAWAWLKRQDGNDIGPLGSLAWNAAFTRSGRSIHGFSAPSASNGGGYTYRLDLDNRTVEVWGSVTGDNSISLWAGGTDGHSMVVIPDSGQTLVLGWYRETTGSPYRLRHFSLSGGVLSLIASPVGNWYDDADIGAGIYALDYEPRLHAVIACAAGDRDIRIMRVA